MKQCAPGIFTVPKEAVWIVLYGWAWLGPSSDAYAQKQKDTLTAQPRACIPHHYSSQLWDLFFFSLQCNSFPITVWLLWQDNTISCSSESRVTFWGSGGGSRFGAVCARCHSTTETALACGSVTPVWLPVQPRTDSTWGASHIIRHTWAAWLCLQRGHPFWNSARILPLDCRNGQARRHLIAGWSWATGHLFKEQNAA